MTRTEINKKISELRQEWDIQHEPCVVFPGTWDKQVPKDWHLDANWPTLLREILEPNSEVSFSHWAPTSYLVIKKKTPFSVFTDICRNKERVENRFDSGDISDAVCLAWIKWKESQ